MKIEFWVATDKVRSESIRTIDVDDEDIEDCINDLDLVSLLFDILDNDVKPMLTESGWRFPGDWKRETEVTLASIRERPEE